MRAVHHRRLGLPIAEWPPLWRIGWLETGTPRGFLDEPVRAGTWSLRRRRQATWDAERFLAWLGREQPEALLMERPGSILSPELLYRFSRAERARGLRYNSLATALGNVVGVVDAIGPEIEQERRNRLWNVIDAVRQRARQQRSATRHFVEPAELYAAGIGWMEATLDEEGNCRDADSWQSGLMMALLAAAPIRISNFSSLELGVHLRNVGDTWTIELSAGETKTGRADTWPTPRSLARFLQYFVDELRPGMLARGKLNTAHARIWVGAYGQPLEHQGVRARIRTITEARFGRPVLPHSFRHAAATAFFMQHPEKARDAAALLGHTGFRTTERHYVASRRAVALQTAQKLLREYRRDRSQAREGQGDPNSAQDARGVCTRVQE
ncbi:tyrosine-type recombinase/integrase [Falsiroseomonas ponticola]|uniref:tyrosine-type recombinase/integrase n=1 Tax=Falsiroseomonas ponticola TaxID=2786951 RepID=UPI00193449D9|nr:tyrosine-type recombinase/integrase [Roseomonas ponticola]